MESVFPEQCLVLQSAKDSAKKSERFLYGRNLLDLLRRLLSEYPTALTSGGDSQAKDCFGKDEYAAKESETVMKSQRLKELRTFEYEGKPVEMFRHLKIGVAEDVERTIRVHFHWDSARSRIVIGYCGEHLRLAK